MEAEAVLAEEAGFEEIEEEEEEDDDGVEEINLDENKLTLTQVSGDDDDTDPAFEVLNSEADDLPEDEMDLIDDPNEEMG